MSTSSGNTQIVELRIDGMHCAGCVSRVEQALTSVPGVVRADVNLAEGRAVVSTDRPVEPGMLRQAVTSAGYQASVLRQQNLGAAEDEDEERGLRENRTWLVRFLLGGVLTVPILGLEWLGHRHEPSLTQAVLATLVQLAVGWPYHQGAFKALRRGTADMDTLVSLGTTVAWAFAIAGLFTTVAGSFGFHDAPLLLTIVTLGKWLEARARHHTGSALRALLQLLPRRVTVVREGKEISIDAEELRRGDILVVSPGQQLAADGVVDSGFSAIDESMLTGESLPVEKAPGERVYAGTLNAHGVLHVRVTHLGAETRFGQIVALVRQAQSSRAPVQRLADRIAAWFVPVVLVLALLTLLGQGLLQGWEPAVRAAVAVVVVACPCALGLATPTAVIVGVGAAARGGILFRSAEVLERVAAVTTVVFDKTGTLTEGRPVVEQVLPLAGVSADEVLRVAVTAEAGSEHPLGQAVLAHAQALGIQPEKRISSATVPGRGVRAATSQGVYRVGKLDFLRSEGVDMTLADAASLFQKTSLIWVARDRQLLGALTFRDTIKPDAAEAVRQLQTEGCAVHLLTGDRRPAAEVVAQVLGLPADRVHADVLPEGKTTVIQALRGQRQVVAMVGDGINDAPALAAADVGIAIGTGTDVARAAGGVVIVRGEPLKVVETLRLARRTLAIIRQNLGWAFAYNAVLLPLAVVGILPHVWAAVAMAASSVSVVSNSLRLGWGRPGVSNQ